MAYGHTVSCLKGVFRKGNIPFWGGAISNSTIELFSLFTTSAIGYADINCFDAWMAACAKINVDFKFSVANNIILKRQLWRFIKVPELAAFYGELRTMRRLEGLGMRPRKE